MVYNRFTNSCYISILTSHNWDFFLTPIKHPPPSFSPTHQQKASMRQTVHFLSTKLNSFGCTQGTVPHSKVDCSQSHIFSVGFTRLVRFDRTSAILVCRGKNATWRVFPIHAPLSSSDTLPRLRSLLQTKMAGVRSKRTSLENPREKIGDFEQSNSKAAGQPIVHGFRASSNKVRSST